MLISTKQNSLFVTLFSSKKFSSRIVLFFLIPNFVLANAKSSTLSCENFLLPQRALTISQSQELTTLQDQTTKNFLFTITNVFFVAALVKAVEQSGDWIIKPVLDDNEPLPLPSGDVFKFDYFSNKRKKAALRKYLNDLSDDRLSKIAISAVVILQDTFTQARGSNQDMVEMFDEFQDISTGTIKETLSFISSFNGHEDKLASSLYALLRADKYFYFLAQLRSNEFKPESLKIDSKVNVRVGAGLGVILGGPIVHVATVISSIAAGLPLESFIASQPILYPLYCVLCGATIGVAGFSVPLNRTFKKISIDLETEENHQLKYATSLLSEVGVKLLTQDSPRLLASPDKKWITGDYRLELKKFLDTHSQSSEVYLSKNDIDLMSKLTSFGDLQIKNISLGAWLMARISSQINSVESEVSNHARQVQVILSKSKAKGLSDEKSAEVDVLLKAMESKIVELQILQSDLNLVIETFIQCTTKIEDLINQLKSFISDNTDLSYGLSYAAKAKLEMLLETQTSNELLEKSYLSILNGSLRFAIIKSHLEVLVDQLNLYSVTQGRHAEALLRQIAD